MASKYDPLADYLKRQAGERFPMSFKQIDEIVEGGLPDAAWKHRAWWSNNMNFTSARNGWVAAGWKTSRVDMDAQKLIFIRIKNTTTFGDTLSEHGRDYSPSLTYQFSNTEANLIREIIDQSGGVQNLSHIVLTIEQYISGEFVETELGRRLRQLWPRKG